MRNAIEKLSPRAEFWVVVLLAFGYFIAGSTWSFFNAHQRIFTDARALWLVTFECLVLGVVAWIARIRGWTIRGLGLNPSWKLTGAGVLLYFAGTFTLGIGYALASAAVRVPDARLTAGSLSLWAVLVVSAINPVFEETLVVGYIVRMTSGEGAAFAITVSALIRFLYHTYQGPIAAVCILPLGLLFAAVYVRYGELWPLIVAHAWMDFAGLLNLMYAAR